MAELSHPPHPYFPIDAKVPDYVENENSVLYLLSMFACIFSGHLYLTDILLWKANKPLARGDKLSAMWFAFCGSLHLFFEGFYLYNWRAMGHLQTMFGQLWKEYALSDSRYLTQDPFVLSAETITVVALCPLSYLTSLLITKSHPLRHPFQIVVSVGHLYSDTLYYTTAAFSSYVYGVEYSRPESQYFWGYYVLLNSFWIVVPIILLRNSFVAVSNKFGAVDGHENQRDAKTT